MDCCKAKNIYVQLYVWKMQASTWCYLVDIHQVSLPNRKFSRKGCTRLEWLYCSWAPSKTILQVGYARSHDLFSLAWGRLCDARSFERQITNWNATKRCCEESYKRKRETGKSDDDPRFTIVREVDWGHSQRSRVRDVATLLRHASSYSTTTGIFQAPKENSVIEYGRQEYSNRYASARNPLDHQTYRRIWIPTEVSKAGKHRQLYKYYNRHSRQKLKNCKRVRNRGPNGNIDKETSLSKKGGLKKSFKSKRMNRTVSKRNFIHFPIPCHPPDLRSSLSPIIKHILVVIMHTKFRQVTIERYSASRRSSCWIVANWVLFP